MAVEFMKHLDRSLKYLHRQGAFLTVKNQDGKENVMTISWGNIGFEWGRPIFTVLVRNSRYTAELIDQAAEFTVSIPTSSAFKDKLAFAGTRSGRDMDKFDQGIITRAAAKAVDVSTVLEADIIYECRVIYKHKIDPQILSDEVLQTSYRDGDYHTIFYGEILECYRRDSSS